jgi:hypothetical protein
MAKKTHEEMLIVLVHKGNANQNHINIHLTPVRIVSSRTQTTTNVGSHQHLDVKKKEPSYTAGRNVS